MYCVVMSCHAMQCNVMKIAHRTGILPMPTDRGIELDIPPPPPGSPAANDGPKNEEV